MKNSYSKPQKISAACDGLVIEGTIDAVREFLAITEFIRRRPTMRKMHPAPAMVLSTLHEQLRKIDGH